MGRKLILSGAVLIALAAAIAVGALSRLHAGSDALWRIISQQCLPHQRLGNPAPCQQVDLARGYVVLKDRTGPLQYLLMPTAKVSGIESPQLLAAGTPNYFQLAWQHRDLLAQRRGAPVPEDAISLAVNSRWGRSQHQLHLHLSCLRPDVRQTIDRLAPTLGERWQPLMLRGHRWIARTLTPTELAGLSPFRRLHYEWPPARAHMARFGMALVALPSGELLLLALERDFLRLNLASAEELQDHTCAILQA